MKTLLMLLTSILTLVGDQVGAESIQSTDSRAPKIHDCEVKRQTSLGTWDDAIVCKEKDMLILRREDTIYSLLMVEGARPEKLSKLAALRDTQIVACIPMNEKIWLLVNPSQTHAFAIEVYSGKVAFFEISKLMVPGSHAPRIQSYVASTHSSSTILMIEGGDRESWPRDGNRPVYFWLSLESGRVVSFPIGWDLDYFSMDQRVAVFGMTKEEAFQRKAVSMRSGERLDALPGRKGDGYVPFNWSETQDLKPVYMHRPNMGDRAYFGGLSANGQVLPIGLDLEEVFYLAQAKEAEGFVGFRLRRSGGSAGEPSPLWLLKDEDLTDPERVASLVTDFVLLNTGNSVVSEAGHGTKKASSEAFFRALNPHSSWNVLDGISRLPELDKDLAEKNYVQDSMGVRLIEGFGNHSPIALCLFEHSRGDMRSLAVPSQEKLVKRELWRRAVVVTSKGERCLTPLFREGRVPDIVWLHNSGLLISGLTKAGKFHLSLSNLELPHASR